MYAQKQSVQTYACTTRSWQRSNLCPDMSSALSRSVCLAKWLTVNSHAENGNSMESSEYSIPIVSTMDYASLTYFDLR